MAPKSKINLLDSTFWLLGGGILIFASYWSVRFSLADYFYRENTISSLSRAVALAGGNAEYRALLAEHLEGVGTDPDPLFLKAAALSPDDSRYWIRLGFSAEAKGNYKQAEDYLLRAASVNRKFDPAWALMNFYFRRDRPVQFWIWSDKALAMSYGDLSAVYRLFWDMSDDPRLIRSHIPSRPDTLARYLYFLELNRHPEAATAVAKDLALLGVADNVQDLLQYCDRALTYDEQSALDVWNTLCRRKLLPVAPLNPDRGEIIGDPEFAFFPSPAVFGWRLFGPEGVIILRAWEPRGLRISFSGNQPEDCVLLEALLPVTPKSRFRILYRTKFEPDTVISGLAWEVITEKEPISILVSSEFDATNPSGIISFETRNESTVHLRLHYRRPLGSTLARGALVVESVHSGLAP